MELLLTAADVEFLHTIGISAEPEVIEEFADRHIEELSMLHEYAEVER